MMSAIDWLTPGQGRRRQAEEEVEPVLEDSTSSDDGEEDAPANQVDEMDQGTSKQDLKQDLFAWR